MSNARIEVTGEDHFDEREWLRREVLWASLMSPYSAQMAGWFNGTQVSQHMGNFSRATLYEEADLDIEAQSKAFFNQGKNIGGIISSATLFRVNPNESELQSLYGDLQPISERVLELQAKNVDIALGNIVIRCIDSDDDIAAYEECQRLSSRAYALRNDFAQRRLLLRAGKIMSGLAKPEVIKWQEMAVQDDENTLPVLAIPNGGTPRSAGPRVEMLQPIFHEIINSERYQALKQ